MPAFIQISDPHIVAKGDLVCGHSDTATALRRAVASINERLPELGPIDCAIVTGDLTDHGTDEEYAHFKEIMADLHLPWQAIPGNHDSHDGMRRAFSTEHWMPAAGPIQWLRDFGPFALIGLDTLMDGAHHGWLADEGFAFLDQTLAGLDGQPVIVATHHPWLPSGIPAMDADNLRNGATLLQRLQGYRGTAKMISGHVHRAITGQIGTVSCLISPSTAHAVHRDPHPDAVHSLALEPGGVTLHLWLDTPLQGFISDVLPITPKPEVWPFG
ncbi:phosphodiesterase [Pseudotabrizicola alkalilacus]|uniref:Phosphodiesterase n=1 Tax=Pseudotabrizicola alkalilacus TaxID=2305252 RepID=A0A411Z0C8_9RHOB|nr:phosphodiesterase [Pseudotabrizicola alkalilacus]RGP36519.1 phosphodiesterase [Pseudotabrizicola alkalilacus]